MLHRYFFWLFLISLFFSSCREEEPLLRSPELRTPIITGLLLTDLYGNALGEWGNPNHKISGNTTGCNQKVEIGVYPVPASSSVHLYFSSVCNVPITVWITPARLAHDVARDGISFGNAHVLKAGRLAIKTLTKEQINVDQIFWDGTDDSGKIVPPGFYRIYCRTGDLLLWNDILLYQDNADNIPLSLLKFFGNG